MRDNPYKDLPPLERRPDGFFLRGLSSAQDQGHRPRQGEQIQDNQIAPVVTGVEIALLQQIAYAAESLEKVDLRLPGHLDSAVHLEGQPGHPQHQSQGYHNPLAAQGAAQQLIAFEGADPHYHAADDRHIAQLTDQNDTDRAQKRAQNRTHYASHKIFVFCLLLHGFPPLRVARPDQLR